MQKKLNPYVEALPDSLQIKLNERYSNLFSILNKHEEKISRVTFWGESEKYSWKNNLPVRRRTDYPLLFDRNNMPKPTYYSVQKTLENI